MQQDMTGEKTNMLWIRQPVNKHGDVTEEENFFSTHFSV